MNYKEEADAKQLILAEYRALNKVVGELLLVENATAEEMTDLDYYNRKLVEARLKVRRELKQDPKPVKAQNTKREPCAPNHSGNSSTKRRETRSGN